MAKINYLDFDLLFEGSKAGYRVRVLNSPAGQATARFTLPFSELELENFLLRVGRTRRGARRLESPEMEAARIFGGNLFKAVFGGDVQSCLRSSLNEARRKEAGLRIRLRLADAYDLVDLPWEYLYDSTLDRFLVLSVGTPIVRYLDLPERIQPLAVEPPLTVMVMISSPSDYPPLKVDQEWQKLKDSLNNLELRGQVNLVRMEEATLAALQRQIRRGDHHIFHYIGHGGYDEQAKDGLLILANEQGRGRPVSGHALGTLLHDEHTLRLAILNSCEGARTSRIDLFAGTAQSLVQQGIPAVVAMQFEITDKAAITFSQEFYTALTDGYPVEAAVAEARRAVFAQDNDVEWGTPVLYMRAPDGRIFDVERASAEDQLQTQVAALYGEAQVEIDRKDWATAVKKLQAVLALDPAHEEASIALRQARQWHKLETLYQRGLRHYHAGRWRQSLNFFSEVQEMRGSYKDVDSLVADINEIIAPPKHSPPKSRTWLLIGIPTTLVLFLIVCVGGYLALNYFLLGPAPTSGLPAAVLEATITRTPTPSFTPLPLTPTPSQTETDLTLTPSLTPTVPTRTLTPSPTISRTPRIVVTTPAAATLLRTSFENLSISNPDDITPFLFTGEFPGMYVWSYSEHPESTNWEVGTRSRTGNLALNAIPNGNPDTDLARTATTSISSALLDIVFNVSEYDMVSLKFWINSTSNPRIESVHSCDSSVRVYYKIDSGEWTSKSGICGQHKSEATGWRPLSLNFDVAGKSTIQFALEYELQNNPTADPTVYFYLDDLEVTAE